jgi:imidazolonepropionase-like amidohydrolase
MGSDAVFTMFGENARELEWFVKAGMTPAEALATVTVNAARLLGMEKVVGRIAPGFYADIVALKGNPLESVDPLINGVVWVMKDGEIIADAREQATPGP